MTGAPSSSPTPQSGHVSIQRMSSRPSAHAHNADAPAATTTYRFNASVAGHGRTPRAGPADDTHTDACADTNDRAPYTTTLPPPLPLPRTPLCINHTHGDPITSATPASFTSLPDVAHEYIASFLSLWDVLRASLCSRTVQDAYRGQIRRLALRYDDTAERGVEASLETHKRRVALIALLRGLEGLRELRVPDARAIRALGEALKAGYGHRIQVFKIGQMKCRRREVELDRLAIAVRAGALADLRVMELCGGALRGMDAFISALADGGCPNLHTLEITDHGTLTNDTLRSLAHAFDSRRVQQQHQRVDATKNAVPLNIDQSKDVVNVCSQSEDVVNVCSQSEEVVKVNIDQSVTSGHVSTNRMGYAMAAAAITTTTTAAAAAATSAAGGKLISGGGGSIGGCTGGVSLDSSGDHGGRVRGGGGGSSDRGGSASILRSGGGGGGGSSVLRCLSLRGMDKGVSEGLQRLFDSLTTPTKTHTHTTHTQVCDTDTHTNDAHITHPPESSSPQTPLSGVRATVCAQHTHAHTHTRAHTHTGTLERLEAGGLGGWHIPAVAAYITHTRARALRELKLWGSCDNKPYDDLAMALKSGGAAYLRSLSLSSGAFWQTSLHSLADAVGSGALRCLETLVVDAESTDAAGVHALMHGMAQGHRCVHLRELVFTTRLGNSGACGAVASAMRIGAFPSIQNLWLEGCRVTDDEVRELSEALTKHQKSHATHPLRALRLRYAQLRPAGVRALMCALENGALSGLQRLHLSGLGHADEGLQCLARALVGLPSATPTPTHTHTGEPSAAGAAPVGVGGGGGGGTDTNGPRSRRSDGGAAAALTSAAAITTLIAAAASAASGGGQESGRGGEDVCAIGETCHGDGGGDNDDGAGSDDTHTETSDGGERGGVCVDAQRADTHAHSDTDTQTQTHTHSDTDAHTHTHVWRSDDGRGDGGDGYAGHTRTHTHAHNTHDAHRQFCDTHTRGRVCEGVAHTHAHAHLHTRMHSGVCVRGGVCAELRELSISCTVISEVGLAALAEALLHGACPQLSSLHFGSIRGDHISTNGMTPLARVLKGHAPCSRSLRALSLTTRSLNTEAVCTLATALESPHGVRLHSLDLSHAMMGEEGMVALVCALGGDAGKELVELRLHHTDITERSLHALSDAITQGQMPELREVGLTQAPVAGARRVSSAIEARKRRGAV